MMHRVVAAEVLDGLPQDDPSAIRSRRDLRRVHRAMGTRKIILHKLQAMKLARLEVEPLRVLEIGAGDGSLMLGVAQSLFCAWPKVALTLLDRQALVTRPPWPITGHLAGRWPPKWAMCWTGRRVTRKRHRMHPRVGTWWSPTCFCTILRVRNWPG